VVVAVATTVVCVASAARVISFLAACAACVCVLAVAAVYAQRRGRGLGRHSPDPPFVAVINLDRNADRLRNFATAYYDVSDLAPLTLTRVPGVDGKAVDWTRFVSRDALERLMTVARTGYRESHPDLTPGAVGCYLSHLRAWDAIAESGAAYGIVFEDDASPPDGVYAALRGAIANVPENDDWDMMLLGYFGGRARRVGNGVARVDSFLGMHGYAITARAIAELRDTMLPMSQQVDWEMNGRIASRGLRVYALDPPLVVQRWQGTDIQQPLRRR
jgi:glycosyl transferase family 25